jgi:hypothetical protein
MWKDDLSNNSTAKYVADEKLASMKAANDNNTSSIELTSFSP